MAVDDPLPQGPDGVATSLELAPASRLFAYMLAAALVANEGAATTLQTPAVFAKRVLTATRVLLPLLNR